MAIKVPETKVTRSSVYREAGEARYAEAIFLKAEHPSGAIYLAGYLVECYLKWALCERSGVQYLQDLPDSNLAESLTSGAGHNLETLCDVTGYSNHFQANNTVMRAFQMAAGWSPNIRYVKACGGNREAVQFLAAVRLLRQDIATWANS
ncbi:MAG: hypothetical protein GY835_24995 [bacterium]|nr:hypothetical protein [bacterium]